MEFIIPNFRNKSVEKILHRLGFKNLTKFDFDSYYRFKKSDLFFSILKSGDFRDDSGFYFTYGEFSCLSTVDANDLNFQRFPENVTLFASSFAGGASGYPLCFENIKQSKKEQIIDSNRKVQQVIVTQHLSKCGAKYFLPYAGFFSERAKRDEYILNNNIKNTLEDYESLLQNKDVKFLNIKNKDSFYFLGNEIIDSTVIPREKSLDLENPEDNLKRVFSNIVLGDDYVEDFFVKSGFQDNLKVFFELTNDGFDQTLKFFSVDFSKKSPIVDFSGFAWREIKTQKSSEYLRKLRIKVRKDSFMWVLKNNIPFEELSIGFQCRIDRIPDIYNVDFWYHFTNKYIN